MEDEVLHSASLDLPGASPCIRGPVAFFAVMDGHGGFKAAQYTRDHLQAHVLANLCRPDATVAGALAAAFESVDAAFMSSAQNDTSGTTCVAMLIELPTGQCWVANAGDSRCVVARGADAVALSVDHKADRPDEVQRIIGAGGFVFNGRVLGELAVSRAIGDSDLKTRGKFLISTPEIVSTSIDLAHDRFAVLACDGLYDVMSNSGIVSFITEELGKSNTNLDRISQGIVKCAIDDLLTRDNVSVIIVQFSAAL